MNGKIIQGDALEELKKLPDESIDLVVTDPPYGLEFMGKDWDRAVPSVEVWRECLRLLKPGAFAFIMSAPRMDVLSEMGRRLQEAGFRIDFSPIYWTYASGFPKSSNISKMVDKRLGAEREVKGTYKTGYSKSQFESGYRPKEYELKILDNTPITPQAKALDGSYAGCQLKPAVEIILVCMKPLSEKTYVEQAMKNGKGITWLDSVRIPYSGKGDRETTKFGAKQVGFGVSDTDYGEGTIPNEGQLSSEQGRFPANLLVSDDIFDENSRFFSLDAWASKLPKDVQKTYPFLLVPKASKGEKNKGCENLPLQKRSEANKMMGDAGTMKTGSGNDGTVEFHNNHPTVKPLKLMQYLITLGSRENDTILDPFLGSGTTAIAAETLGRNWIGIELSEEYCKIAEARLKPYLQQRRLSE